jgi:uncharacterized membrane protein YfcA
VILTIGVCVAALCIFIGVNIGSELPVDSIAWFAGAAVVAVALVFYLRSDSRPAKAPPPHAGKRVKAAPSGGAPPDSPERPQQHGS